MIVYLDKFYDSTVHTTKGIDADMLSQSNDLLLEYSSFVCRMIEESDMELDRVHGELKVELKKPSTSTCSLFADVLLSSIQGTLYTSLVRGYLDLIDSDVSTSYEYAREVEEVPLVLAEAITDNAIYFCASKENVK